MNYIMPDATITVEFYGSEPVGIELPPTVDLKVDDTAPGIKGATASNQIKPATLETGLVVNVPPFVNTGDKVRVSTDTGEYLSRAWMDVTPSLVRAHGWIEVIAGSMFSGKSEELIRRLRRAQIAKRKVQIFKPQDRQPLRRRPHHLAQRDADRVRERRRRRASCSSRC